MRRLLARHWRLLATIAGLAVALVPFMTGARLLVGVPCLVLGFVLVIAAATVESIEVTQ